MKYLKLEHVIDVLADCDIHHIDLDYMVLINKEGKKNNRVCGTYEPACCEDGINRIYIDSSRRIDGRKKTIIHELVHAYFDLIKYNENEKETSIIEKETYNKLYKKHKDGKIHHKRFRKIKCHT